MKRILPLFVLLTVAPVLQAQAQKTTSQKMVGLFRDVVAKLPDYEVLKKYMRASGGYVVPDKKGAFWVSFTLKEQE